MKGKMILGIAGLLAILCAACSHNAPPPGNYPPVSANQALLSASAEMGGATVLIRSVTCSPENPSAYSVSVEWLSSAGYAKRGVLEYAVISRRQPIETAALNKTASSFEVVEDSGEATFEISHNEVSEVGDSIVVRLKIQKENGAVITSEPDEYPVTELCGG